MLLVSSACHTLPPGSYMPHVLIFIVLFLKCFLFFFPWCGPLKKKSLLNLSQCCFCFFLFCFGLAFWPWGMWDLIPLIRDQTSNCRFGRWSLNHWTTREVPHLSSLHLKDPYLGWAFPTNLYTISSPLLVIAHCLSPPLLYILFLCHYGAYCFDWQPDWLVICPLPQ